MSWCSCVVVVVVVGGGSGERDRHRDRAVRAMLSVVSVAVYFTDSSR